jgi:hypothetical protein
MARHRAAKLGYRVHRSRRRKGRDDAGEFMLIHKASSTVLLRGWLHRKLAGDHGVHGTGADPMTINNKVQENVRPSMKRLAESAGGSRGRLCNADGGANDGQQPAREDYLA